MESATGRLLVATPSIGDANFDRAVIFMLEHTPDGAVGLVLNRPLDTPVAEMVEPWASLVSAPGVFFQGGPVGLEGVVGLGDGPAEATDGWTPIRGRLGTIDLNLAPDEIPAPLAAVRLFAGHSGWGPGQLEAELHAEAWYLVDLHVDDMFSSTPEGLWYDVLRRQPPPLAWLAHFPPDPSFN